MTPTTAVSLLTYKPEVQIHAAGTTSSYSLVNPRQLSSPAHHPKVKQCLGNALPEARAQHSHRGTGNEHRAVLLNSNHASPIRAKPRGDRRLRCSLRRQGRMQKRRGAVRLSAAHRLIGSWLPLAEVLGVPRGGRAPARRGRGHRDRCRRRRCEPVVELILVAPMSMEACGHLSDVTRGEGP